jgi:CHAT domain-containing protein
MQLDQAGQVDQKRVCARTAVGVVPCLSCVTALARQLAREPLLHFFGPPTYQAASESMDDYQAELDRLGVRLTNHGFTSSRGPSQNSATVAAFSDLLREQHSADTILIVACHGEFDVTEPLRSKLNLSDGSVDAATIMIQRIRFEEVVLRACSTGERVDHVGDVDLVGDDILSIPGAFLEAGARSVLVSIPPLVRRPTTRRLFERFLTNRSGGMTPLLALAEAQRAAVDDGDDPADWAGIAVYGVQ